MNRLSQFLNDPSIYTVEDRARSRKQLKKDLHYLEKVSGHIEYVAFQDSSTHKYFKFYIFDVTNNIHDPVHYINDIIFTSHVNMDDFNNPLYGTPQNPIPIFDAEVVRPAGNYVAICGSFEDFVDGELTPKQYEHNVITYLTHVMPIQELNKRYKN